MTTIRIACIAAALLAIGCAGTASADPIASASASCKPPDYPGSGYFTSLRVRGVGCRTGRRVTLAHYRCRTERGPRGRCGHPVLRYRCSETRTSISTEINGRVTCRRGTRRVVYTYQQNL
jgi:hypothetical protein